MLPKRGGLLILAGLLVSMVEAQAQTTVTACGRDDSPGGTNLKAALAIGGAIAFRCPGGTATIQITDAHVLRRSTTIDGAGRITLDARGRVPMFIVYDAGVKLLLKDIAVQGGANSFQSHPGSDAPKGGIVSSRGDVELSGVRTRESREPYDARSVRAYRRSHFEGNTGAFVVRALVIELVEAVMANNEGAPLTISRQRLNAGARASVERSEIYGNRVPIVWHGDLVVRSTRFTNNGDLQTAAGAIWLEGDGTVERSDFVNNRASAGGAITVAGGSLTVRRSTFEGNVAQWRGGALSVLSASTGDIETRLHYVKFRRNRAQDGGAISLEGRLFGGPLLFADNEATRRGGALDLARGDGDLTRAVFVDNRAGLEGGAIRTGASGLGQLRIGNGLIARNDAPLGGGALVRALDLTNGTVVANKGGGLAVVPPAGAHGASGVRIKNTIVALNTGGNCTDSGLIADHEQNLQFPGTDCGSTIPVADPFLDTMFVPYVGSPARFAGDNTTCSEHPLVRARDVYGSARSTTRGCAIGAIEHDLERHAARLLSGRRELPEEIRKFLKILGLQRAP
jgi:hypothetical protein